MSGYNMPDGCSQADLDRYYDPGERGEYEDDIIRCDCGHWDSEGHAEMIDGRLLCLQCADPLPMDPTGAIDRLRKTLAMTPRVAVCPECNEPISDGNPVSHKDGCTAGGEDEIERSRR